MENTTILEYILGGHTVNYVIAFYFYSLFGMLFNLFLHYQYKQERNRKRMGRKTKFNIKFWIADNFSRVSLNFMSIFLTIIFKDSIPLVKDIENNMYAALLVGMSIDVIILFFKKINLNSFQKDIEK